MTLGAGANWYAAHSLPVFPLCLRGKQPLKDSHGFMDATTDTARVAAWWWESPDADIGLATAGFLVLLSARYGTEGQPVPRRWLWVYRAVLRLLRWGSR